LLNIIYRIAIYFDSGFDSGNGNFSLLNTVQTGSVVHPASYPMGTGSFFLRGLSDQGVKLTTRLHLVPRSRMVVLYFNYPIHLDGVVLKHRDKFAFLACPVQQLHPFRFFEIY
jgi:hypothetical protein